jgi:hypothetical protein
VAGLLTFAEVAKVDSFIVKALGAYFTKLLNSVAE